MKCEQMLRVFLMIVKKQREKERANLAPTCPIRTANSSTHRAYQADGSISLYSHSNAPLSNPHCPPTHRRASWSEGRYRPTPPPTTRSGDGCNVKLKVHVKNYICKNSNRHDNKKIEYYDRTLSKNNKVVTQQQLGALT